MRLAVSMIRIIRTTDDLKSTNAAGSAAVAVAPKSGHRARRATVGAVLFGRQPQQRLLCSPTSINEVDVPLPTGSSRCRRPRPQNHLLGYLFGCLFRDRFWNHFGITCGSILGPLLEPFWCHFGSSLSVHAPLRHEIVSQSFSDALNLAKSLKNQCCLKVLRVLIETRHELHMAPEWLENGS